MLAGVQFHIVDGDNGIITREQVEKAIRPQDVHQPQTSLICLENTHNRAGGIIYPIDHMAAISDFARKHGLKMHLDGARLWNASVATGIPLKQYAQYFDSVMLCFSKGLGAPVGSIVVGSREFIQRAHYYRKAYGGGMRQVGILAAAALYALDHHIERLADDHQRAKKLAEAIAELPGIRLDLKTVQTNIVIFEVDPHIMPASRLAAALQEEGILVIPMGTHRIRAVTHLDIDDQAIDRTILAFRRLLKS